MDNADFRNLFFADSSASSKASRTLTRHDGSRNTIAPALGSRMRSSLRMAPRATQVDFARKPAPDCQYQPSTKRIKTSDEVSSQKGTQHNGDEGPTLEERVRALEEARKLGQIDEETFRSLLAKLGVGGDTSSTHLVKGLDWELLQRVKAGEDVTAKPEKQLPVAHAEEPLQDQEEEDFDKFIEEKEKQEVVPAAKEQRIKKGILASPPPAPAPAKMTRDEILRQFKAKRAADAAAAHASLKAASASPQPESTLGSKFKKIGSKDEKKRWVEQDDTGRRREVLLVTGPDGKTKRKVRCIDKQPQSKHQNGTGLLELDKNAKPLGMEVPAEALARAAATNDSDDEDGDIFADAGRDYNPLADIEEDNTSGDEADEVKELKEAKAKGLQKPTQAAKPRNYFATTSTEEVEKEDRSNPLLKDPTFLAAVKKAAALRRAEENADVDTAGGADEETIARRKKFLEEARRREQLDTIDIDMGFGDIRFDDDDDEDLPIVDEKSGNRRKRGPKRKKQDKNSADDVLKVLQGRSKMGNRDK
ncbi:hypothetical protein KEM54_005738 [Ascosphaera aggregata]|nr:hypothetical protein KEM54_005738 [Ascosphaera aggregata]